MGSVGCTVIEMATGTPPWSQQFREVPALFHFGGTKSHPPIPEHLSQGNDFLLKVCIPAQIVKLLLSLLFAVYLVLHGY
jgi:hypothetical protein